MRIRTALIALACLLAFGAVRIPIENHLAARHGAAGLNTAQLDLSLRQRIGQMSFLAALSGFRAVVADLLWIEAHSAWERTEWGRMKLLLDTVTALQPRAILFWDNAAWHMAWNASVAAREDRSQPREALRIRNQREYFKAGEDFLLRGIQNNPSSALLHERLGLLYQDKFRDPARAAEAFQRSAQLPGASQYVHRFALYQLALVPGREAEAYACLKALYQKSKQEHLPTLLRRLQDLEKKLSVPPDQRLPIPESP
jgi:hypothetical protein